MNIKYIVGLDPSFAGFGFCRVHLQDSIISLRIFETHFKSFSYPDVFSACGNVIRECIQAMPVLDSVVGFELPSPRGIMSPALTSLSYLLFERLLKRPYYLVGFNPTYLGHILGKKKYTRSEVVIYALGLLTHMKDLGYTIYDEGEVWDGHSRIKNDKLVAFLFVVRLMIKGRLFVVPLESIYIKLNNEKEIVLTPWRNLDAKGEVAK